jgi:ABC-type uncharacterized transport system involved in gliding motility auxiliary subunit
VGRSAALYGLLGLVFLGFGLAATALVGLDDGYVLLNLVVGAGLVLAYLAFGFEGFRSLVGQRSTRYGAGAAVYTLLFFALVAGGNYLGARHHHRWDLTEASIYTLSPQSRKVVESLKEDLAITAFVEGGVNPQLETLLESYAYAAPAHVKFKLVDPDKEPALVDQMKITTAPSAHLQYGKESFVVTQPTEETITNGVIRVTGTVKKVVYFTEGDGEAGIQDQQDPKGYASAKLGLEQENYEVKTLLLPSAEQIPDDASAVVIAGVERPLGEHAIQALEAYLKRGGHLLMLVGPRQGDGALTKFLADWGAKLGDDIVIDREVRLFEGPRLGIVPLSKTYGTHPITQNFKDYTTYPQTRTVEPDAAGKKGLQATALVKTSASSWAESSVEDVFTKGTASLDDADRKGPLTIAVAVEAKLKDMGVTPPPAAEGKPAPDAARLVVFGTPLFADNQQLVQARLNGDLLLNAVGWLVGQEELVSIRSRSVRASRAELTGKQAQQVFYLSVLIIPELLIATGIAVWWRRRSA